MPKESSLVSDMVIFIVFICIIVYILIFLLSFYLFAKNDINGGCLINNDDIINYGIMSFLWPMFLPVFIIQIQIPKFFIWLFSKINKDE